MRLTIQGKDVEVRVQERRIVVADFIHKGKVVASGTAVCAPVDPFDLREGEKKAVSRAANQMFQLQVDADRAAKEKIGDFLKAAGAISGQIELPRISMVHELYNEIMNRLDKRRAKKAEAAAKETAAAESAKTLCVEKLKELAAKHGTGRFPSFPSLFSIPFLASPYLHAGSAFLLKGMDKAEATAAAEPETPALGGATACGARADGKSMRWFCTRTKGHAGQHIAHDSYRPYAKILDRW